MIGSGRTRAASAQPKAAVPASVSFSSEYTFKAAVANSCI
jgi:hypothetical protein